MADPNERGPGRPIDSDLSEEILTATLALLAKSGFAGLRMDDVVATVGTSKQALYRRWSKKEDLVAAAIEFALGQGNPSAPDTGSLRGDLIALLSNTIRQLRKTHLGGAIRALVGERDPRLEACLKDVETRRRKLMQKVLARGVETGAIGKDRDFDLDIDMMLGAIYFRLLVRKRPLEQDLAEQVVQSWLMGSSGW